MIYINIGADYTDARKNRDTHMINLLSSLIGDAQTKAKNDGVEILGDESMIALIQTHIKNLKITLNALYDNGGTAEQTALAQYDIVSLSKYLPKQFTEFEMRMIVTQFIKDNPASKMGDIMTHFKKNYNGQYDGKLLSTIAKELL